jgi:hypothetical protein
VPGSDGAYLTVHDADIVRALRDGACRLRLAGTAHSRQEEGDVPLLMLVQRNVRRGLGH